MFACEKGYTEIAQKLLSHPSCNAGLKDNDNQSAYDIAKACGHSELSELVQNQLSQSRKRWLIDVTRFI